MRFYRRRMLEHPMIAGQTIRPANRRALKARYFVTSVVSLSLTKSLEMFDDHYITITDNTIYYS